MTEHLLPSPLAFTECRTVELSLVTLVWVNARPAWVSHAFRNAQFAQIRRRGMPMPARVDKVTFWLSLGDGQAR
jgi:hypothetical protein